MATMTLFADSDSRTLRGEVPPGFESAFRALSQERAGFKEEYLEETTLVVSRNQDGTFAVVETNRVLVTSFRDVTSHATLQVVNEGEHCWV